MSDFMRNIKEIFLLLCAFSGFGIATLWQLLGKALDNKYFVLTMLAILALSALKLAGVLPLPWLVILFPIYAPFVVFFGFVLLIAMLSLLLSIKRRK